MDLTIEEAAKEYLELEEYLASENWEFYPVVDNVQRRQKDLCKLVMQKTIDEMLREIKPRYKIDGFDTFCETWGPKH
jgi:hypothetical protein